MHFVRFHYCVINFVRFHYCVINFACFHYCVINFVHFHYYVINLVHFHYCVINLVHFHYCVISVECLAHHDSHYYLYSSRHYKVSSKHPSLFLGYIAFYKCLFILNCKVYLLVCQSSNERRENISGCFRLRLYVKA